MLFSFFKKKKKIPKFTVAFYNLENLFDPADHKNTLDSDFTPKGLKHWTPKRYQLKLRKLAKTICKIGREILGHPPVLIGVAEVENHRVLQDLVETPPMNCTDYDFVHFESPDERGMDTALIYRKKYFTVMLAEPLRLLVKNENGAQDTTRDILYVHGKLNSEEMHVFVNHWPSRRDGANKTAHKRLAAAKVIKDKIDRLQVQSAQANILVMGDFNDDPGSQSMQLLLKDTVLSNPMEKLHIPKNRGTVSYRGEWSLFDQILISHSFFSYDRGTHSFDSAHIFDDSSLIEKEGKRKGSPYRTYAGKKYIGGYSDHFPVYIVLSHYP